MTAEVEFTGDRGGVWRYDPSRPLGPRGGFGQVFEGVADDGARVAIKEVALLGGVSARLRLREKEIADKLRGVDAKNLIPVLDTGLVYDKLLLVMERADGSLAQHIAKEAPLPERESVEIMRNTATGLRELHSAAVIHRDLKPGNVLFHDGRWKLSDFGIARDADLGTQDPTFQGRGTWEYMAPETWEGQSPSFKTDLYSLGCLYFELLAGSVPFGGPGEEDFARQHREEPPPDPNTSDEVLKRLILRLLMKDPAMRPQDARAVEETFASMSDTGAEPLLKIRKFAADHAKEQAVENAELAARKAEEASFYRHHRQATEDLHDLFLAATHRMNRVGALEVEYTKSDAALTISGSYATLEVRMEPGSQFPQVEDTLVSLGEALGENRRGAQGVSLGNVVYEMADDGRYGWWLYKFRKQQVVTIYPFGPSDREHGFNFTHFRQQRPDMVRRPTTAWILRTTRLTSEVIEDLYSEILALPAPPR